MSNAPPITSTARHEADSPDPAARSTLGTLLTFLLGRRAAIITLASSRGTLPLGALFVLSAALAREYDQSDLLAEPWHLLIPFGASIGSAFLLYSLVRAAAWCRGVRDGRFCGLFPSFLGLYWMTAPLAWLYAIPVERILRPGDSVAANLYILAFVSAWRVILAIRIVCVLFGAGFFSGLVIVLCFANVAMLGALFLSPAPIFEVMGGIDYTEDELVLATAMYFGRVLALYALPVWLILLPPVLWPRKKPWTTLRMDENNRVKATPGVWQAASAAIVGWIPLLAWAQPQQRLAHQVEQDLISGRLVDAAEAMSSHERSDFPPLWNPLPRQAYGEDRPPAADVMEAVLSTHPPPWLVELYFWKFRNSTWGVADPQKVERRLAILERVERGPEFAIPLLEWAERHDVEITNSQRRRIEALAKRVDPTGL